MGCEINTGSLHEVQRVVETFRPTVTRLAETQMDAFVENASYGDWDRRRATVRQTRQRDPVVDTDFNLTIFPFEGVFYGMVFTEHQVWFDLWCTMPLVKEYGYWNNTEGPEEVPAHEWRQRKHIWDGIFKTSTIPSMVGWSIDIMDPNGPMPKGWLRDSTRG